MKDKNEHWRWIDKEASRKKKVKAPKVVYKGPEELLRELENLEDALVQKDKEITKLKLELEKTKTSGSMYETRYTTIPF